MRVRLKLKQRNILSGKIVSVQATKEKTRKDVSYAKKFSTYQMGMQVSHRVHAEIQKKNHIQSAEERYLSNSEGFM